jgi:hypothetical protein
MLILLLLSALLIVLTGMFSFIPVVVLPSFIHYPLAVAVGYFQGAIAIFPYLGVVWQMFLLGLVFEVTLLVVKLFMGSRTPIN